MNHVRRLYRHYESYHLHGPMMLRYAGWLGAIAFPAFYLLRFTKADVPYDDAAVRAIATVLCVLLVLRNRWPEKLKPYYIAYSYPALIFALPFAFVFTSLKNGGGPVAVGNTLMVAFFVILVTDWRNTLVMLTVGIAAACGLYWAIDPNPSWPADYVARLPMFLLVVAGGSLFKLAGNQASAEQVRRAYASIAGTIAHEMRNPLSQVRHHLERMRESLPAPDAAGPLPPERVDALYEHLSQGEQAVRRGLQLIAITLDEVSDRPVDPSAFSLLSAAEVTQKAVREFGYDAEEARQAVSVEVQDDFTFRGDETAFVFVLFNLLRNALYYLPLRPGMQVRVVVGQQGITVRDTGPGMEPQAAAALFEPFSSIGKAGGTGLGLAYCRRVMRAFGGEITCESSLGEYTEFQLRFPEVSEQEREAHRLARLEQARRVLAGRRLLVVEDDAAQRMTTRHKLRPLDMVVDEAPDGQRALEMLQQRAYDLLLLDLHMPVLDGYAVAVRLRQGEAPLNRGIRIVAYTSEPAHRAALKARDAGMDGFVTKPGSAMALIGALQQVAESAFGSAESPGRLAGRRILLADDSAQSRKAVAAVLRCAGATVVEAAHGMAVLDEAARHPPWDAVLLDVHMPGMNGLQTARALRERHGPRLPIVALTAHSDLHEVLAAGMNAMLVKPVDARQLHETLLPLIEPAGAGSAPVIAREPEPAWGAEPLLNLARLDSYRRLGMLDELLGDYLPEIRRLLARLEADTARADFAAALDTLHSLLGMTGEAGGLALYQKVRGLYVPMVEQRCWPAAPDWLGQLQALAARTEDALRHYGASERQADVR